MKHLKLFENTTSYESWKNSDGYVLPNVSYVVEAKSVGYEPAPPVKVDVGDIAYYDGSAVKFCTVDKWENSLGTPVGVCVIPEGFAPDGRPRIISLKAVDKNGNATLSHVKLEWQQYGGTDSSLTNYRRVPTMDISSSSISTNSKNSGYLPSDMFAANQGQTIDPEAKYSNKATYGTLIPSPYLGDKPNPEYSKELSDNNALSDFNGLSNTEYVVNLSSYCLAAKAAWNYSDGASNLQWYLPAAGELGYLMARFNKINNSISAVGGAEIGGTATTSAKFFWSSTEYGYSAWGLEITSGYFHSLTAKDSGEYVRPFATV